MRLHPLFSFGVALSIVCRVGFPRLPVLCNLRSAVLGSTEAGNFHTAVCKSCACQRHELCHGGTGRRIALRPACSGSFGSQKQPKQCHHALSECPGHAAAPCQWTKAIGNATQKRTKLLPRLSEPLPRIDGITLKLDLPMRCHLTDHTAMTRRSSAALNSLDKFARVSPTHPTHPATQKSHSRAPAALVEHDLRDAEWSPPRCPSWKRRSRTRLLKGEAARSPTLQRPSRFANARPSFWLPVSSRNSRTIFGEAALAGLAELRNSASADRMRTMLLASSSGVRLKAFGMHD